MNMLVEMTTTTGLDLKPMMSGARVPTTTGDRVKMRRLELELSQTELAARAGLTQPTISALEKNRSHTSGSLASIAKALGISALWLETGLGEMVPTVSDEGQLDQESPDTFTVPLLECKGSCGNGRLYGDIDYSPIQLNARLLGPYRRATSTTNFIALYADGDSMASYIMHGDILVFDTSVRDFEESGIYLLDTPDGLRVKRVSRRTGGRIVLRSDNPDKARYPDEEYSQDEAAELTVKGKFVLRIGG